MRHILAIAAVSALAVACSNGAKKDDIATPPPAPTKATATMQAKSKSKVSGTVDFEEVGGKLRVTYNLTGLKKNSRHGLHIHEKGDCTADDASSAGGHLNPTAHQHGALTAEHHVGDIGNIKADKKGEAKGTVELEGVTVAMIQNAAVIVHAKKDDFKSQPSGNSGDRIACGVIAAH